MVRPALYKSLINSYTASSGSCHMPQVLVTGARTATLLQRLPFLPAADAYVSENGGRIFYPDATLPTACQIAEDARWRARHTPTGAPKPCSL